MNLYDEAIERLNTPIVHDTIYGVYEGYMLSEEERGVVSKALERAKKEHELLELYRKAHIDVLNGELAYQIEALEEELK